MSNLAPYFHRQEEIRITIRNLGKRKQKIDRSVFVSENAYVIGDIRIGRNSSIWPGAVLRADRFRIQIGCNWSIQDNHVIHAGIADVIIGNNVTVGRGSIIHCARIGNNVFIGMHTTLVFFRNWRFLYDGAHSMLKDYFQVPPRSSVLGVPARIKRPVTRRDREDYFPQNFYVGLSRDFIKQAEFDSLAPDGSHTYRFA